MDRIESKEDILNNIAGRITNYVHDIGTEPCKLCESNDMIINTVR